MTEKFIQGAIKHPGELRSYAQHEGCIGSDGRIKDSCVRDHLSHMPKSQRQRHLTRAYNLYHNVLKMERTA